MLVAPKTAQTELTSRSESKLHFWAISVMGTFSFAETESRKAPVPAAQMPLILEVQMFISGL